MCIAQPSILSLCAFRNQDYDSQLWNDPSQTGRSACSTARFPSAEAILLEEILDTLRACPKKYVEGHSIHQAVPPTFRTANPPTIPVVAKSRLTQKYFDS